MVRDRAYQWFLAGFLFLWGTLVGFDWWQAQQRYQAMASWPDVIGSVIQTKLQTSTSRPVPGGSVGYQGDLAYRYRVNGTLYDGRETTLTEFKAAGPRAWLDRRPVGSRVTVYYNPEEPGDSVLDPKPDLDVADYGVSSHNGKRTSAIIVLGIGGLVLLWLLVTRPTPRRNLNPLSPS